MVFSRIASGHVSATGEPSLTLNDRFFSFLDAVDSTALYDYFSLHTCVSLGVIRQGKPSLT